MNTKDVDRTDIEIKSIDDALALLGQLANDDFDFSESDYLNLKITGEIATLSIEIDGPDFHGTITGGLARGLWHYQKEVYKATANALYNDGNYGRIPKQDLKNYTLVFEVEDGCTELIAKVAEIAKHVTERVMDGMTPKEKAALWLKIVLGLSGVVAAVYITTSISEDYFSHETTTEVAQIEAQKNHGDNEIEAARIAAEIERSRIQAQLIQQVVASNPISKRFDEAAADGVRAIAKYSPEATRIKVGIGELDRSQIEEINQRSAREVADVFNMVGYFTVTSTFKADGDGLSRISVIGNGESFSATMHLTDPENPIPDEVSDTVFLAPKTGKKIYMNIRIRKTSDGIKEAAIIGFPTPPTDPV